MSKEGGTAFVFKHAVKVLFAGTLTSSAMHVQSVLVELEEEDKPVTLDRRQGGGHCALSVQGGGAVGRESKLSN